jgi:hypothetical protein
VGPLPLLLLLLLGGCLQGLVLLLQLLRDICHCARPFG